MNIKNRFVALFAALAMFVGTAFAALPAIAPTGQAGLAVSTTSTNVQIPTAGTPTQIMVTNMGPLTAFVALGTSNTVSVTPSTGTPILPYTSVVLTLGSNTWLAGATQGSGTVLLLTAGT